MLARWPGKFPAGTIINDIFSQQDWMTTLLSIVGEPDIKEKLLKGGVKANGKTFKAHLDGYDQTDALMGKGPGKRHEIFYFDAAGGLNCLRYDDWKVIWTEMSGALPTAWHKTPSWPALVNLRRDPYERFMEQSQMYTKWWADRMFVMVPAQVYVQQFLESLKEFPPASGSSLSIDKVLASMTTESKTTQ